MSSVLIGREHPGELFALIQSPEGAHGVTLHCTRVCADTVARGRSQGFR